MQIHLSDHFTYKRLLRFVLPCVVMMLVSTTYSVVDGFFVSNFVGKNAFAAVNLIVPALMALGAFGQMFGTGGSALISFTLGTGNTERANRILSQVIRFLFLFGVVAAILGFLFMRQIAVALGASESMIEACVLYGRTLICVMPFYMLQHAFQSLLVTAEKPKMGLAVSVVAGLTNILLDFVLVYVFPLGLLGAALATALSWVMGGAVPAVFFSKENTSLLRFTKTRLEREVLAKVSTNGVAGLLTNLSTSIVAILYNYQLMRLAGENGVAAYGVIMYVSYVFMAFSMGYSTGSSPIAGYKFGAGDVLELKSLLRKSLMLNAIFGIMMTILAEGLSWPIAQIFVGYDSGLSALTAHAIRLYSLAFLINGFNIFSVSFFTGLNDGKIASIISFLRTFILPIIAIFVLPIMLDVDGIWIAVVVAEGLTLFVTIGLLIGNRKKYRY
ncbi:MAG: MATE family efflux transporter [Clostridiales bacterium]|nr:MATE family efflux transporter [Clostridiales bacterium]